MRLRFSVDVVVEENGDITSCKSLEIEDLTEDTAVVIPDLNILQNAFRSGIISILTEELISAPEPDDNDDDFDTDDDDDLNTDGEIDSIGQPNQ